MYGMKFRFLFSIAILAVMVSCAPKQATATPKATDADQGETSPARFSLVVGGLQFVEFYSDI